MHWGETRLLPNHQLREYECLPGLSTAALPAGGSWVLRSLWVATIGLAALLGVADARAQQPSPVPTVVIYRAPEGCPTREAFLDQVRTRTTNAWLVDERGQAPRFVVTIDNEAEGAVGRLFAQDMYGAPVLRQVQGGSCAEVFHALALITALTIDPGAQPSGPAVAAPTAPIPIEPARPIRQRNPSYWSAGTQWVGLAHVGPTFGSAPGMFLEYALGSPSVPATFRLAPWLMQDHVEADGGGVAQFRWLVGRVEACPLGVGMPGRIHLWPCMSLDLGELRASGSQLNRARTETRLWSALGGFVRIQSMLWGPLFAELQGGAYTPMTRDSFVFGAPKTVVYQAPSVGVETRVGIGLRFL